MFLRTSGRPRNGCPAGEGPWIRRSRLEHASSCTGEIRSCKDLPDSPPMEPVVYFPEIICFVRSWPTRAGTVRRRTTAVHLSTSLKSVAEARETAERRSRKLSLDQSTRARGGAFGPGSPVAMAARATRAGGFPEPDDTRDFIRWRRVRLPHARPHAVACSSWRGAVWYSHGPRCPGSSRMP